MVAEFLGSSRMTGMAIAITTIKTISAALYDDEVS